MKVNPKVLEQEIAVFGESGSGKTVLLSSFYGATQEPEWLRESLFNVVAERTKQGTHLHRNYLGMKNSAALPKQNQFNWDSYAFSVKLKNAGGTAAKKKQFDAVRLVWHDYPGEWFEQDANGPEEATRRVDAFRSLLGSDVALLLVDAQRLIDNQGEEERYLKSLFSNIRNVLLSLKDDLLDDGNKLVEFPRIWMISLSKADLLPDMDIYAFRDLIVEKACDEVDELRKVLEEMVQGSNALSIGEDFMLLSSANFEPHQIRLDERIGVDLVLPTAAILPFERHVRWASNKTLPNEVASSILQGAAELASALVNNKRTWLPQGMNNILRVVVGTGILDEAVSLANDALANANTNARAQRDTLRATLTQFKMDLNEGEQNRVLLRSVK